MSVTQTTLLMQGAEAVFDITLPPLPHPSSSLLQIESLCCSFVFLENIFGALIRSACGNQGEAQEGIPCSGAGFEN